MIYNVDIKVWDHTGYVFSVRLLECLPSIPMPWVQFLGQKSKRP